MPRPVHFELTAENVDRASAFYKSVFGWTFQKWDGPMAYWMAITGPDGEPGINGGVRGRMPGETAGTTNTINVASVDAAVETIKAAGGTIVLEKMAVPGVGWLAYAVDTEGNQFGVMEADHAAA